MKFTLKILMSAVIGFAVGYLTLEVLYGRSSEGTLETIYFWMSIAMIVISIVLLVFAFIRRRNLMRMIKTGNHSMSEDDFDIYSYNSFNLLTIATSVSLVLSLMALAIQSMAAEALWLVIVTVVLFFVSFYMNLKASSLINVIYPDKDLPEPGDKKYGQKLFDASDEGELFIMAKGLYSTWNLTTALLFFAIVLMIFYSVITSESQIFSIIITGLIMIVSQLKYSYEIREK